MPERDEIDEQLHAYEVSIGIRSGFIEELQEQDDWTFIIKAHAIVEAGLSQLLAHKLGHPEQLQKLFADLSTGGQHGKLAFVRALKLLSPKIIRFTNPAEPPSH